MIGQTDLYKEFVDLQSVPSPCSQEKLIGLELHTFVHRANYGAIVRNVTFGGYKRGTCGGVYHIQMDDAVSSQCRMS